MAAGIVETSSQGSSRNTGRQQGAPQNERARLVQRLLDAAGDLPTFVTDLLATQAVTVVGTEAAAFLIERVPAQDGQVQASFKAIAHIRPDESDAQTRAAALNAFQDLIRRCVVEGKDGAIEVGTPNIGNEPQYCLITLLRDGAEIVAVSAVVTRCMNLERAKQRLSSMQLVAGYFEFFSLRRTAEASRQMSVNHQRVLQLSRSVADAEGFQSAAMNLCNELANATGASRVSLGWVKGRVVRIAALSHTEEFDKKQELIVQLEKAMEECFDQEQAVLYDPAGGNPLGGDAVTRQAAVLSRAQSGHVVLSLPLRHHHDIEGVITLEFIGSEKLTAKVLESLTIATELLAPQLYDRHANDRWLVTKMGLSTRYGLEELLGPRHWIAKLITIGVALLVLVLTNFFDIPVHVHALAWADIRPTYRVTAPVTFAAIERRSVCAPFDGQIAEVYAKPGEPILKGAKLFSLKTDEQLKQKLKAQSEALSHTRKAQAYAADNTKIAEQHVELAQAAAAQAEADLYQLQIDKATVVAPFDGQILSTKNGDLQDKRDVEVKQGEEQLVFGNPRKLRAELSVHDADIQDIRETERGALATTAKPTEKYKFTVDRVIPLGQPKEGSNVFTVYASMDQTAPSWLPGMNGEAHVDVGRRTWAWIWTHRLVDFVRLKTWM